jgi:hypothetical protein
MLETSSGHHNSDSVRPGLHEFLAGTRGAGQVVLRAIANHAGVGVDVVLGRAAAPSPSLNRHPDWTRARAQAERDHPEIPAAMLDMVGRGQLPSEIPGEQAAIDGALVAGLAREWMSAAARAEARRRTAT